jgi:DNA polymerase-3 subunit gamma/tau
MSLFDDDPPAMALPGLEAAASPVQAIAYRVLARKYRPTDFGDLIGQDVLVRILRNAFRLDRVAHAFMLTGVRGVGKTTTARIIARALNCIGPDGAGGPTADPCGVCANCVAILADRHPDVTEMDAASRTGVDDVREIIEATRFRPLQARTRVFIIDEVHMLSRNAFNALLKTLEEPPPHVKFVFATTDIRKVPVTVLSRCQRFDLRRVSVAELSAHFARIAAKEEVAIDDEALAAIARAAEGSVRDGLSLLDQAIAQATPGEPIQAASVFEMLGVSDRDSLFDLTEAVMAGRVADMLAVTDRAHERGADLGVMLADLLDLLHTLSSQGHPGAAQQPRPAGDGAHARGGAGRPARYGDDRPRLADGAEGYAGGGNRAGSPGRGRDGADPAVLRRRPAATGRAGPPTHRHGRSGRRPTLARAVRRRWRGPRVSSAGRHAGGGGGRLDARAAA